jgi:hypothetical protein
LFVWLTDESNRNKWIESGKLRKELFIIADKENLNLKQYKNNQLYGRELRNIATTFSRIYKVDDDNTRGRNKYRFGDKS